MMRFTYRAGSSLGIWFVLLLWAAVLSAQPAQAKDSATPDASPAIASPQTTSDTGQNVAAATADAALPSGSAGKTLTIGTKIAPPFVYRGPDGQLTGLSIALWNQVADTLGLKTKYVVRPLGELISGLVDGSLDVSVAALTVTEQRESKIDFSYPFYTTGLGIAVPRQNSDPILSTARRFFSWQFFTALGTLAAVLLLVGMLVWLFERRRNPEEFGGSVLQGLGSGFWWAAVTMTTVGYGDKSPQTLFGRLIGLVWMFAAIIIISSFTAAIATSLTVGSLSSGISGVRDLQHAQVVTVGGSAAAEALRARGLTFRTEPDLIHALDAVANGEADAAVYDAPLLRYRIDHRYSQQLSVLDDTFDRQDYAFAMAEGSPLREPINRAILARLNDSRWNMMLQRYLGGS